MSAENLVESLRTDILAGKVRTGARVPTERELIARTGLSRAAVRGVYDRLVGEGLIVRFRRRGTFVRSNTPVQHNAKGLSLVFLLGMELGHPLMEKHAYWPGRALVGLERGAKSHNDSWIYVTENANAPAGELIPRSVDMQAIDGIVSYALPSSTDRENLASYLESMGKPHVALNEYFTEHGGNCVVDNCESGMRALVNRIAELGHYDTVFCMYEVPYTVYPARLEAYKAAVLAAGLPFYPPVITPGKFSLENPGEVFGEAIARQILEMRRRPTAVVCACDPLALGIMGFLQAEGVKIPEEMSVLGYDGTSGSETSRPTLTTVLQDFTALGEEAVECVHRMVGDPGYRGEEVRVAASCAFRESLGPAPKRG